MQTTAASTTSVMEISARARELEQDAARYPDERAEILLEAAHQWQRVGQVDHAFALLNEVLTLGVEDAAYARFSLADLCFKQGAESEAWEHLRAMEEMTSPGVGPLGLVAEMLEERGEYEAALRWFDRAAETVDVEAITRPDAGPSLQAGALFGRQRCRVRLGLPADELDHAADMAEDNRGRFVERLDAWLAGVGQGGSQAGPGFQSAAASQRSTVRMLVWQRAEQQVAAQRWPEVFTPEVLGNHAAIEEQLRELSTDHTVTKIVLVPGSVDGFAAYLRENRGDPADMAVRLAYSEQVSKQGRTLTWPPGRNDRCWCGSQRKYKKCCGAPATAR